MWGIVTISLSRTKWAGNMQHKRIVGMLVCVVGSDDVGAGWWGSDPQKLLIGICRQEFIVL